MVQSWVRAFYFRIEFAILFRHLESLLYLHRNGHDTADSIMVFYARLASFPFVYYQMENGDENPRRLVTQMTSLPDGRIKGVFLKNSGIFAKLDELAQPSPVLQDFSSLEAELRLFLDEVFAALKPGPLTTKARYFIRGMIWSIAIVAILFSVFHLRLRYIEERIEYEWLSLGEARFQKPVYDILSLQKALAKYFEDHQSYPKSSGGWDAKFAAFGESKKEWIPGLAPDYISDLPVDPRQNNNPREQYMYISDGADYKLISHNPENMQYIIDNYPELVDPRRTTWAFGVWTEKAIDW